MSDWSVLLADSDFGVVEPVTFEEQDKIYDVMRGAKPESIHSLDFYLVENSIRTAHIGDTLFSGGLNIFSQKLVEILGETLQKFGLLIPVSIRDVDEQFYWYAVTTELDCLDMQGSKFSLMSGSTDKIAHIRSIVLKPLPSICDSIFRLPQGPYNVTFVGEYIVNELSSLDLKGIRFGGPNCFDLGASS